MYFGNSLFVNFFVYYGSKPGRHFARNLASLASLAGGTGGESVNSAGLSSQSERAKTLSTDLVIPETHKGLKRVTRVQCL